MPSFIDQLAEAVRAKRSPLMVGLDPRAASLPDELKLPEGAPLEAVAEAYVGFCRGVIDAVAELTPIVKPQAAFFEQLGPTGMTALAEVIAYAREAGLLVCLDGKRNDIGTTAEAYADGWLGRQSPWGADALTVSPYLGDDSLEPFASAASDRDAGVFVLVKTSNPGGALWQDQPLGGEQTLYQQVGAHVDQLSAASQGACGYGVAGAVVGATYPEQLAELRRAMPHTWFLIPGFGSQGGTAKDVAGGFDAKGLGAVVNSSRGVIFAYQKSPTTGSWQEAVRKAAQDAVDQFRTETAAGLL